MVDLEPDGISIDGLETVLATAVHPKLAHIIPNFQNPAGYTLRADKAQAAAGARGRARLHDLRGRPVRLDPLRGRDDPVDVLPGRRRPRRLRVARSPRPSARASASATWSARRRSSRRSRRSRTNTYISPNMVAQSIVNQFARSGRMDGAINTVKTALRGASRRGDHRARARDPRGHLRAPRGRLLHVGGAARGRQRRGAREGRGRARGAVREGHRLPARGRREHAAAGLLGRDPGADRRGHHQARRGAPLAWVSQRHSYGDDPSQYGVLYGEGPVAVLIHGGFWVAGTT